MRVTDNDLSALGAQYEALLELTPRARDLLGTLSRADAIARDYAATRFVKVPDILPAAPLTELAHGLLPILLPISDEVIMPHREESESVLSVGGRFLRVDPARLASEAASDKMMQLFGILGLTEWGNQMGAKLTPLIRHIVGPVSYRRFYFYVYEEGDYISAHDDRQVGDRVDVQFTVAHATAGGVRVLSDGLFQMHYDAAGSMNVLGPSMWHDVPPLIRSVPDVAPWRLNFGMRFTPDTSPD
jgi:hypothetical protein